MPKTRSAKPRRSSGRRTTPQNASSTRRLARAEQVRFEARERADEYRRERIDTATREAAARLEAGRAEIAAARAAQTERLREQVVDCVGLACERLLGEPDPDAIDAAVDRLMARRVG